MGSQQELLDALAAVGADRDGNGNFLIHYGGVTSFMGVDDPNNDVVVDDIACYSVGGQMRNLSEMMNGRGVGLCNVVVIS